VENGYGVTGAINGYPFPIPKTGVEVIWNHLLRYRSEGVARLVSQAAPTRGGDYTLVDFADEFYMIYSMDGMKEEDLNNKILFFKQEVLAPARLAGGVLLVHETLNQVKEHRSAWLYNPGQRRVRRAPNVAYDNPGTAADGMRTSDQLDMFNGAVDKYDWKLVGKQEIYVPYNSYTLHGPNLKYKDILTPLHINQEYPRYELHRVWVVDATLREGERHIYKRRVFSTTTTTATSCGGSQRATRSTSTMCHASGRPWRSTPTSRRGATWRSVSTTRTSAPSSISSAPSRTTRRRRCGAKACGKPYRWIIAAGPTPSGRDSLSDGRRLPQWNSPATFECFR
jgi:hypothetical protein